MNLRERKHDRRQSSWKKLIRRQKWLHFIRKYRKQPWFLNNWPPMCLANAAWKGQRFDHWTEFILVTQNDLQPTSLVRGEFFPTWPYFEIGELLLMLQKSGEKTTFWMYTNLVNIGINYLSLNWWVNAGFLNHQQYQGPKFACRFCFWNEVLENANDSVVTVESRYRIVL